MPEHDEPTVPVVRVLDGADAELAATALGFTIQIAGLLSLESIGPDMLEAMMDLYARLTGELD